MDFIKNFNGLELIFIVILAILLFGPEKIPEIAATLGSWVRKIRNLSARFMEMLDDEAGLSEITRETSQITSSLNETQIDVNLRSQQSRPKSPDTSREPGTSSTPASTDPGKSTPPKNQLEDRLHTLEKELEQIRAEIAQQESKKASPSDDG